jgi:hypothetical protein
MCTWEEEITEFGENYIADWVNNMNLSAQILRPHNNLKCEKPNK